MIDIERIRLVEPISDISDSREQPWSAYNVSIFGNPFSDNEHFNNIINEYSNHMKLCRFKTDPYGANAGTINIERLDYREDVSIRPSDITDYKIKNNLISILIDTSSSSHLSWQNPSSEYSIIVDIKSEEEKRLFSDFEYQMGRERKGNKESTVFANITKLLNNMTDYPITLKGEEVYNIINGEKTIILENGQILDTYRKSKEFAWRMFNYYCEDTLNTIEYIFPEYKQWMRESIIDELTEEDGEN